jgi:hypothetical protein
MKPFALVLGVLAALMCLAAESADAQTPTPSPTVAEGTPTPTPTFVPVNLDLSGEGISWEPVPGAQSYQITVDALLYNVSLANFCGPVVEFMPVEINLMKALPASTTQLLFELPPLPPEEEWFLKDANVSFVALDANGSAIAGQGRGFIAEGCMPQPTAVPTERPALPATGRSADPSSGVTMVVVIVASAVAALFGGAFVLRQRS